MCVCVYEQNAPILWKKFSIESENNEFDLKTVYLESFVFSSDWIDAWQCGSYVKNIQQTWFKLSSLIDTYKSANWNACQTLQLISIDDIQSQYDMLLLCEEIVTMRVAQQSGDWIACIRKWNVILFTPKYRMCITTKEHFWFLVSDSTTEHSLL